MTARSEKLPTPARLRPRDVLAVGLSGLRGRKLRAVLSALGIAIGVAAMVAVVGIGTSSQARLADQIAKLGTNLLTVAPGQSFAGTAAQLPSDADAMVERIGPVESATATGKTDATVRRNDRIEPGITGGIQVLASREDLLGTVGGKLRAGRFLDAATGNFPTVVLGDTAAKRLGVTEPGGQVWLGGQWFTVIGLLDPVPLADDLDVSALVGWEAAIKYLGFSGNPTTVYTRTAESAVEAVRDVLAPTVNPKNPNEVKVSRPSDALAAQLAAKDTFNALLLGLGAVALLVGGVGVANTMVIAVLERRQEIGLRRALGAHRGQIRTQFLTEAVTLAGLGGIAGAALGGAATYAYATAKDWPFAIPIAALAGAVAASALVGAVAGLYPAGRAARLTPTEALATG
ncbi:ABC transporter permease [Yinghuangia soli]|uniref:ABC transporter permease n=1 Tax=Yinghuangia soli TaxID=2908204 RepID=A0AA41Q4Y8_9ACTN|nr:ABC transporter permease [Yinghuangia soli]MCF2531649.1 ABC transporter permease [Yinghuangia soli]